MCVYTTDTSSHSIFNNKKQFYDHNSIYSENRLDAFHSQVMNTKFSCQVRAFLVLSVDFCSELCFHFGSFFCCFFSKFFLVSRNITASDGDRGIRCTRLYDKRYLPLFAPKKRLFSRIESFVCKNFFLQNIFYKKKLIF